MPPVGGDGHASRGESGRWAVMIEAGSGGWSIVDTKAGLGIAFGAHSEDLVDLHAAITACIDGGA